MSVAITPLPPDLMRGGAILLPAFFSAFSASALAEPVDGRLELQDFGTFARSNTLDGILAGPNRNDASSNLRLTWAPQWDRFRFEIHYVVDAQYGDSVPLTRLATLGPLPPSTLFNLTETFENDSRLFAQQSIDRLSLAYSTDSVVLRVGRQALTWGNGLVFRPMDLFDPFAPNATDTEFKTGTDMVYAQFLFGDGSDLQAIVVPRPDVSGGQPSSNASSFAGLYRRAFGAIQTSWLLARDHGDWTAAAEATGPLGGASWTLELVPVFPHAGGTRVSALANFSDATTLFDRNATVFAEYFHNGFGETGGDLTLATLPPDLRDRLARGQLFTFRQNYLAGGLTLEWTPLLTFSPTLIADLDDGSVYALAAANYSLSDNLVLIGGAQVPLGARNTEFGGLRLSPAVTTTFGPAPQVYVQLRRYF
ncbi:MAG TPA: hypothetical protein VGG10_19355 [Rhizomicrobium sp.]|jgi:hypothetical protein